MRSRLDSASDRTGGQAEDQRQENQHHQQDDKASANPGEIDVSALARQVLMGLVALVFDGGGNGATEQAELLPQVFAQALLRAAVLGKRGCRAQFGLVCRWASQLLCQFGHLLGTGAAVTLRVEHRTLHALQTIGGLLQQGLHVGGTDASPSLPMPPADSLVVPTAILRVRCRSDWGATESSSRPITSEPARPNSEVEKLVAMPESGVCNLSLSASNIATASLPPDSPAMMSLTEPMVFSSQKVPSRPRKISGPIR